MRIQNVSKGFYEIVDEIIDQYLTDNLLPSYVGTALFKESKRLEDIYYKLQAYKITSIEANKLIRDTLLPNYVIRRESIMPTTIIDLPDDTVSFGSRLAIYINNPQQFAHLIPFINNINRSLVLLCEQGVELNVEMPEYVECIDLDYSVAEAYITLDNSLSQKLAKSYVTFNSIISGLQLEGIVLLEGCHYQEQMIGEICSRLGIPTIVLQLEWPPIIHTAFRRFPYSHFLTWGDAFSELWKEFNPRQCYYSAGFPFPEIIKNEVEAISFFLHASAGDDYCHILLDIAKQTAEKLPDKKILIKELTESVVPLSKKEELISKSNIFFVSDLPVANIYGCSAVIISQFSSLLIEGVAYGCIPIAFDPSKYTEHSLNLVNTGLGYLASTDSDFFIKLTEALANKTLFLKNISTKGRNWFCAINRDTVLNQTKAVNTIAPPAAFLRNYRKLNLGCGRNILSDWLNADLRCMSPQTLQMDASKTFPFPENSFDYIFSEHMFEHLDLAGQQNMFRESFRILNKGGILRLTTPNFDFLVDLINNPDSEINRKYLEWSYRKFVAYKVNYDIDRKEYPVYVVNNFMRAWGHKFIHSKNSLIHMGRTVGFSHTSVCSIRLSTSPALCECEGHDIEIPEWANELETMIIEFYKR